MSCAIGAEMQKIAKTENAFNVAEEICAKLKLYAQ